MIGIGNAMVIDAKHGFKPQPVPSHYAPKPTTHGQYHSLHKTRKHGIL
jgi:hypothetical protein